ncbi:HNH endonuclease [compost metagenome]
MPAVIAENDESKWDDKTGESYHFPKQYRAILSEGTAVLYYKGKMKNKAFSQERLSASPHYFGVARIGRVFPDKNSTKGDLFAVIEDFRSFENAVPIKIDGQYLEPIPPKLEKNYWWSGVRAIDESVFENIVSYASLTVQSDKFGSIDRDQEFETTVTGLEGKKIAYFGVRYERSAKLRREAIAIHGVACNVCGFDFAKAYGEHAKGFIHVHHVKPISEFEGDQAVDPATDLITLCANCHAAVHRRPDELLSVDQLKSILHGRWVFDDLVED